MDITARPASPSNYTKGRVDLIVVHVEEGSNPGTAATFGSAQAHASAHYGIAKDGSILQFVGEADVAWHAGNAVTNARSIGIELEGFTASLAMPGLQLSALIELTLVLCDRYRIPIDRAHIIGHDEVPDPRDPTKLGGQNHHTDPGLLFPWQEFMEALNAPRVA